MGRGRGTIMEDGLLSEEEGEIFGRKIRGREKREEISKMNLSGKRGK